MKITNTTNWSFYTGKMLFFSNFRMIAGRAGKVVVIYYKFYTKNRALSISLSLAKLYNRLGGNGCAIFEVGDITDHVTESFFLKNISNRLQEKLFGFIYTNTLEAFIPIFFDAPKPCHGNQEPRDFHNASKIIALLSYYFQS